MTSPARPRAPNPHAAALAQYRRRASVYNTELALFEPIRRATIECLALRHGDSVIDVGCGTGLSLPLLHRAVGGAGQIIGVEQCPEMLAQARDSVCRHRWHNVTLIEASAEDAALACQADAALFHFTHDILRTPRALANVNAALRPGARVAASGLQWANVWAWPLNLFVLGAALHSVSSLEGLNRPWSLLADSLEAMTVKPLLGGAVFLAQGTRRA
jgi:ubiquinone/menaquinone biosynthesis C-methylase UbiE